MVCGLLKVVEGEYKKPLNSSTVAAMHTNLLDDSSDYEIILPLLVVALKKFPSNDEIREGAMNMMDRSCSTINDKKIIERSGALEVLAILLASDEINDEDEKDTVRTLIGKRSSHSTVDNKAIDQLIDRLIY